MKEAAEALTDNRGKKSTRRKGRRPREQSLVYLLGHLSFITAIVTAFDSSLASSRNRSALAVASGLDVNTSPDEIQEGEIGPRWSPLRSYTAYTNDGRR